MNKEKICLIFQYKNGINYWFDWFKNKYRNYIFLLDGVKKNIQLKNGIVLYFRTESDVIKGLKFNKHINGEHLESICLNYENQQLHNKIDKAIEFIKQAQYDDELKSYVYGLNATGTRKLLKILKGSDVDE